MLEMLIKFVLDVVVTIINFIMTPFMNILFAMFPSLQAYFSYVNTFLTQAFTYVSTIIQWLLFTPSMFILLFDYYVVKYSIHILVIGIKFAINIYNKLKP